MPQHVDVHRERQPSSLASPFYHASDTHTAEWLAAHIDEHASPLDPVSLLLPLQQLETVHLIALEVMDAISAALEPARDDGPRSVASLGQGYLFSKAVHRDEATAMLLRLAQKQSDIAGALVA